MGDEERVGGVEEGHLVGTPEISAEWSSREGEELPHSTTLAGNPHGRVSSWVVVVTAFLAFAVGGVALIFHAWVLVGICAVVVVLMFPLGLALHIMDDTVGWSEPTPGEITRGNMTRAALRYREEQLRLLQESQTQSGSHPEE